MIGTLHWKMFFFCESMDQNIQLMIGSWNSALLLITMWTRIHLDKMMSTLAYYVLTCICVEAQMHKSLVTNNW
jgi:fatty-acid desaturase